MVSLPGAGAEVSLGDTVFVTTDRRAVPAFGEFRPGNKHTNCDGLSQIRPCEIEGGEPCRQCHKRVGTEHVNSVTTRAAARLGLATKKHSAACCICRT